ncbi:MAG: transposase [Blautia sp.]|nr:transposase [Blautia sp.]
MAVFWGKSVPIPKIKGITINRSDMNKVLFVKEAPYDAKLGYAKPKRNTIGYVCDNDSKQMHPTTGYKLLFPALWEKYFHEKVPEIYKHIGMYAMADAINSKTGIKDIMDECFGTVHANAMYDFALYSMLFHTSVAEHIDSRMKNQQLFSGKCYSDSFYSDLFNNDIAYDQILLFKKKWALQCKEDGVDTVWLCVDGSNDDCESKGVVFAEKGHAKSLRNRKIVSFTYAVTETGKPVTFEIYRGGLVDAKAMKRILSFLEEAGITVRGVILDRGYCDSESLKYLESESIPYIIMVKGSPAGYTDLVNAFGNKIKLNAEYLIRGTYLFGVQEKVQLFEKYNHEDFLTLFYDYKNGGERISALLKKLYKEIDRVERALAEGNNVSIVPSFKSVLSISEDQKKAEIIPAELQKILDEKGLYSIVSSEEMTPKEVHRLYQARNNSETEYSIIKTQLGYGKVRVHATKAVQSKFAIGFISTCIRYELQVAAEYVNRTTNEVIQELNMLSMTKVGDTYVPIQGIMGRQIEILKKLGSSEDLLLQISKDENDRLAGRHPVPRHRKSGPKKGKGKNESPEKKPAEEPAVPIPKDTSKVGRKKPGVKPGTKRGVTKRDGSPRKKPGVPTGYKRSNYNKDGSLRKKPGPKPKIAVS